MTRRYMSLETLDGLSHDTDARPPTSLWLDQPEPP